MLNEGVYFAPSAFEAGFLSAAHSAADIEATAAAAGRVFASMGPVGPAMRAFAWFVGAIVLAGVIGALLAYPAYS